MEINKYNLKNINKLYKNNEVIFKIIYKINKI